MTFHGTQGSASIFSFKPEENLVGYEILPIFWISGVILSRSLDQEMFLLKSLVEVYIVSISSFSNNNISYQNIFVEASWVIFGNSQTEEFLVPQYRLTLVSG